jgi:hypothetical protein
MKLGEIYVWDTPKAAGHESRRKYHVYVCPADWRDGHTFLFVSKADYGGDFAISNKDYPFFPLPTSYISCGSIVCYEDAELAAVKPKLEGQLSKEHMTALYHAIAASETMEQWKILRVCNALKVVL